MAIDQISNKKKRSEEEIAEDVKRLREWLSKQPHLPHEIDEQMIRCFITGTKSLEIAKNKLDSWFTDKGKYPMYFSYEMRDPYGQTFRDLFSYARVWILPKTTPDGARVVMSEGGSDISKFSIDSVAMLFTVIVDLAINTWPETTHFCYVCNLKGVDNSIYAKLRPKVIIFLTQWLQRSVPIRPRNVIIINSLPFMDTVANMLSPFIKEKLFRRFVITRRDKDCLSDYLPTPILPSDYGGDEIHSQQLCVDFEKRIKESSDLFKKASLLVSDESKRPTDENNSYGIDGTFRTLAID